MTNTDGSGGDTRQQAGAPAAIHPDDVLDTIGLFCPEIPSSFSRSTQPRVSGTVGGRCFADSGRNRYPGMPHSFSIILNA